MQLDLEQKRELLELLSERDRRKSGLSFYSLFPDEDTVWTGPKTRIFDRGQLIHARRRYPKSLAIFAATAEYREVNVMAANRVGKTVDAGYAATVWATGLYPDWWIGRRFSGPVDIWVAGQTNETTRDILQTKLFGDVMIVDGRKGMAGNGIVPRELINNPPTWKAGVTELIDTIYIKHYSGSHSRVGVKSYNQGRLSFEGTEKDVIIFDEESPREIYDEGLIRTMTKPGAVVLSAFTPLLGLSETSKLFIPGESD